MDLPEEPEPARDALRSRVGPCPHCGSRRTASILYGMPGFDEELRGALDAGTVVLGGCVLEADAPTACCLDCGREWRA